jgi:hypothetical protein
MRHVSAYLADIAPKSIISGARLGARGGAARSALAGAWRQAGRIAEPEQRLGRNSSKDQTSRNREAAKEIFFCVLLVGLPFRTSFWPSTPSIELARGVLSGAMRWIYKAIYLNDN